MFEDLGLYRVIVVTGPQRSGTRIAAHMIAADLAGIGHAYVDETAYGIRDEARFRALVVEGPARVIHAPAMCHLVHEPGLGDREDVCIAAVLREIAEIAASQARVDWSAKAQARQLSLYGRVLGEDVQIAEIKYATWLTHQRPRVRHWYEIDYRSLAGHPLWVPDAGRKEFKTDQWKA